MMAKRYVKEMLNEGIAPTCHTFNVLLWSFFLSLRLEMVKRFYKDIKSIGISPDVFKYNTIINGYYRIKHGDASLVIVNGRMGDVQVPAKASDRFVGILNKMAFTYEQEMSCRTRRHEIFRGNYW